MEEGGVQLAGKHKTTSAEMPLISIITVVYNAEKVLEETILSVVNRNYANIQFIVIDGGSTDGTIDILKKYNTQIDYWKSEPDKGIYDAMNKAIDMVTGDWVYFIGAGDVLLNVVDKVAANLNDASTIYYGDVYRTDLLRVYDGQFSAFKLAVNNICHQAIFYPSAALKKYKYDIKYKSQADHKMNMQLYGDATFRFKYLPIIVCNYEGAGFSDLNLDKPFLRDKMNLIKANLPFFVWAYAITRHKIARFLFKTTYTD